jgi:hypothetical protein
MPDYLCGADKSRVRGRSAQMPKTCGEPAEPCGGTMKIVAFIEESRVIEKNLRHCELWKEPAMHPPPVKSTGPLKMESGLELDYQFVDQNSF